MNETLAALRARLGHPSRFEIDADRQRPKRAVTTAVRWTCGCRAAGRSYTALTLEPCPAHAPAFATAVRRRIPRLAALIGRA